MIYDVILFNGERDILDIRLNVLKDCVDEFIICEAPITFSGNPKPLYFLEQEDKYKAWPIKYFVINEPVYSKYFDLAKSSPNTEYGQGAKHWLLEFAVKESLKDALVDLNNEDMVFVSDCDEIWNPDKLSILTDGVYKLTQKAYAYYLNMRTSEVWLGTLLTRYKNIKGVCLNHLRTSGWTRLDNDGWHFSNCMSIDEVRRKINDSYTNESLPIGEIQNLLERRFGNSDFLGRPYNFTYGVDESGWPQYLKANKEKYAKYCYPGV